MAQVQGHPGDAVKTCRHCQVSKPTTDFRMDKKAGDGRHRNPVLSSKCRPCEAAKAREVRRQHPERHRAVLYRSNLKANWGMTTEMFEERQVKQGGGCAICGGQSPKGRLAVDHDHRSGQIRGLLCVRCNTGLGSFMDNPHLLQQAIHYLERAKGEVSSCQH